MILRTSRGDLGTTDLNWASSQRSAHPYS